MPAANDAAPQYAPEPDYPVPSDDREMPEAPEASGVFACAVEAQAQAHVDVVPGHPGDTWGTFAEILALAHLHGDWAAAFGANIRGQIAAGSPLTQKQKQKILSYFPADRAA